MTRTIRERIDFVGGGIIPATGSADSGHFGLVQKITGAGPPTVAPAAGECVLALEATSEVQNACLYQDDDLSYDIDDIRRVIFWARLSVALGSAAKMRFGLAVARNDDPNAITTSVLFGCDGDANVNVEADDGTNELAATTTGQTLATTKRKFVLDFTSGLHSESPPTLSSGGTAKVIAKMEDSNGVLQQVAADSRLNVSAYTGKVQLFAQIQKTSATDVGSLAIEAIEIERLVAN